MKKHKFCTTKTSTVVWVAQLLQKCHASFVTFGYYALNHCSDTTYPNRIENNPLFSTLTITFVKFFLYKWKINRKGKGIYFPFTFFSIRYEEITEIMVAIIMVLKIRVIQRKKFQKFGNENQFLYSEKPK